MSSDQFEFDDPSEIKLVIGTVPNMYKRQKSLDEREVQEQSEMASQFAEESPRKMQVIVKEVDEDDEDDMDLDREYPIFQLEDNITLKKDQKSKDAN